MKVFNFLEFCTKVYPAFRTTPPSRPVYLLLHFIIIASILALLVTSLLFFVLEAKTFNDYAESAFPAIAALSFASIYFVITLNRDNFLELIDHLQDIVDKRTENPVLKTLYAKSHEKLYKWIKLAAAVFIPSPIIINIPGVMFCYYKYYTSDHSPDSFRLMVPATFPFDWRTPIGYICASIFLLNASNSMVEMAVLVVSFTFAFCQYVDTFIEDFTITYNDLDNTSSGDHEQIMEKIYDIVQFHASIKRFASHFISIFSYVCEAVLEICLTTYCISLLIINIAIVNSNMTDLLRSVGLAFMIISGLFICCFTGEQVTSHFENLAQMTYVCNWYRLSVKQQKYFLLMILVQQEPISLHGLSSFEWTLDMFKSVIKGGYSYFITFREFLH